MSLQIIAGLYRGRRLISPKGDQTRPTQGILREALFNILQNQIAGSHFLDLFAGSGAIGLEALSRGAQEVVFVEHNRLALQALKANIERLACKARVLPFDIFKALKLLSNPFDLIFADPPYDQIDLPRLLSSLSHLVKPETSLFLEVPAASPSFSPAQWRLIDQRKFGIARLDRYICEK
jgi:16S rRNA (guanine(966)-N(2))-methyltransferase RsmD